MMRERVVVGKRMGKAFASVLVAIALVSGCGGGDAGVGGDEPKEEPIAETSVEADAQGGSESGAVDVGGSPSASDTSSAELQVATTVDEYAFDSFEDIDVSASIADVKFEVDDGYTLTIDRTNYPALRAEVDDGMLVVDEPDGTWDSADSHCTITICASSSAQIERTLLSASTGSVSVEGVAVTDLTATVDTGDIATVDCKAQRLDLSSDTGSISVSGIEDLTNASLDLMTEAGEVIVGYAEYEGTYTQAGDGVTILARSDTGDISIR